MTSGVFTAVALNEITVNRAERQRRELKNIPELADSISSLGLVHPIVIRRDTHELIAGERRLAAVRSLGWTHINVQFQDELDTFTLKRLELEENTKRDDITWQERCSAIAAYDALHKANDPSWTISKTAEALGASSGYVSEHIAVANEIKTNPKVANAERYSIAKNITSRLNERRVQSATSGSGDTNPQSDTILNEDFLKWAPSYSGPLFNFIHCDFPYGINADHIQQGYKVLEHGGYADTFEHYASLIEGLSSNLDRFCEPSAHLIFWFSMKHYDFTFKALSKIFNISPYPLIWFKSDNSGIIPDTQRGPRQVYETAFFGYRGDRKIISAVANCTAVPSTAAVHMSEKPVDMLRHFFRMFVDDSTSILDPTCGGGSALRAAELAGAKRMLGLEVNAEFRNRAVQLLDQQRKKPS